MSKTVQIPLLSTREGLHEQVGTLLERGAPGVRCAWCTTPGELGIFLAAESPAVALVDLDPDPATLLRQIERLARVHVGTRFVLLCQSLDTRLVLEAMQAGARHCLEKGKLASELLTVVQRFLSEGLSSEASQGRLVTILSASGGSGATSLAINLASECGERLGEPTLLVDLDLAYGSIATQLGIEARYGLADVLEQPGRIDPELVRSTATVHGERLHVLVSPVSVDFSRPAQAQLGHLEAALAALRQAYSFSVVDAPRVPMDAAATLAQASNLTLITAQLDVVDIRTVRATLQALEERGLSRERLVVVANRYQKRRAALDLDDVREALGEIEILTVRNDYEGVLRSINYGRPLSQVAARSGVRKDLGLLLDRRQLAG